MCGSFVFTSGMAYETAFPYMSETAPSVWRGFLYEADPLRIYTSVFYHLAWLIGEVAGMPGSFVPYQMVYAMLWWAGGLLLFVALRRLFPAQALLCYTIGALLLVHASDGALLWVGQMNHFGFMFWLLLACYCFIVAAQSGKPAHAALFAALACLFEYMSLWSYESQLFILLVFPVLILFLNRPVARRLRLISLAWYLVPAVYVWLTVAKYLRTFAGSYQHGVMRSNWSVTGILGDWLFNIAASVSVWSWHEQTGDMPRAQVLLLSTLATAFFAVGAAMLAKKPDTPRDLAVTSKILIAGTVVLVLSFPVYLLLALARVLWRTQLLAGIGAAMVLGGIVALPAARLPRRAGRAVWLALPALIVFYGSFCAIELGGYHRRRWTFHREVMAAVIRAVPQVKPGTMFVLTNVSRRQDPFEANDWFESALRLAYPGTPVSGVFFYEGGITPRGSNQRLESNQWHWDGTPLIPVVTKAKLDDTLILEYQAGSATVLPEVPTFVCTGGCTPEHYRPRERISGTRPSPRAMHRYGPL
jgi:hypothetical protein